MNASKRISVILGSGCLQLVMSCSKLDEPTQHSSRTKSSRTASGTTVQADDGSSARGTTIFIPASANDIESDRFQIENGPARIANQTTAAYLNAPGTIRGAGEPVAVIYGDALIHEQAGALILSLPTQTQNGLALRQSITDFVVFYEVFTASNEMTTIGVIPNSELNIDSDRISFRLRGFGIYQLATSSEPIAAELSRSNDGSALPLNNLPSIRKALAQTTATQDTTRDKNSTEASTTSGGSGTEGTGSTSGNSGTSGTSSSGTTTDSGSTSGSASGTSSGSSSRGDSSSGGTGSGGSTWLAGWTELSPNVFESATGAVASQISQVSTAISPNGSFVAVSARIGEFGSFMVKRYTNGSSNPVSFGFSSTIAEGESIVTSKVSVDDSGMVFLALLIRGSGTMSLNKLQIMAFLNPGSVQMLEKTLGDLAANDGTPHIELYAHSSRGVINISSATIAGLASGKCSVIAFEFNSDPYSNKISTVNGLVVDPDASAGRQCGARMVGHGPMLMFLTPVMRGESIHIDRGFVHLNESIDSQNFTSAPLTLALPVGLGSEMINLFSGQIQIVPTSSGQHLTAIRHSDPNFGVLIHSASEPDFFARPKSNTTVAGLLPLALSPSGSRSLTSGIECADASCQIFDTNHSNIPSIESTRTAGDLFALVTQTGPIVIDRIGAFATSRDQQTWSSWLQAPTDVNQIDATSLDFSTLSGAIVLTRLSNILGSEAKVQALVYVK